MDKNTPYKIALFIILVIAIIAVGLSSYHKDKPVVAMSKSNYETQIHTIDSLNVVVDSLQTEIFMLEDGFDFKEHRYEDVIFQYELGIGYLKDYHPTAYKDFHRIIGMSERYSNELKIENNKRLNQYKK